MQVGGSWIIFTQEVLKVSNWGKKSEIFAFLDELGTLKLKVKVCGNWAVTPFLPSCLNHWDLSTDWGGWSVSQSVRSDDTSEDS